jgi:hypothetical protein
MFTTKVAADTLGKTHIFRKYGRKSFLLLLPKHKVGNRSFLLDFFATKNPKPLNTKTTKYENPQCTKLCTGGLSFPSIENSPKSLNKNSPNRHHWRLGLFRFSPSKLSSPSHPHKGVNQLRRGSRVKFQFDGLISRVFPIQQQHKIVTRSPPENLPVKIRRIVNPNFHLSLLCKRFSEITLFVSRKRQFLLILRLKNIRFSLDSRWNSPSFRLYANHRGGPSKHFVLFKSEGTYST